MVVVGITVNDEPKAAQVTDEATADDVVDSVADDVVDADLTYADALTELEQLLDDLEGADTDVDLLAQRVARGVELVRFCRARLEVVADDVDAVVAELISVDAADGTPDVANALEDVDPAEDDQ